MVGCGSRSMVGCGLVGVGLGLVVTNLALVLHVGVILCVLINIVVNDLGPAVRQQNLVLTLDCLSFPNFSLGVNVWVAIGVFLMNVISIVVRGWLMVGSRRGRMVGSRGRGVVRCGSRSWVSHIWGWVVRKGSHWVEGVGSQGRAVDGVDWGSSCVHQGVVCSVGLADSVRDSCDVSVDHLMAGLVSGGSHHQGRNSDKGLHGC